MPKLSRSAAAKHGSLTRLIDLYGTKNVVIRHRSGRRKSPNVFARYVKANFKKMKRSGEKSPAVLKRIAKKWNASPKASGKRNKRKASGKRKASRK